ncbi:MAG: glycosyltransferase family A protein [Pseudomonadota bacterium]
MTSTLRIAVAICTYRRASVADAIRSVDAQKDISIDHILVIDNDDVPSAKPIIDALAPLRRIPLKYIHEPGRNISRARNKALEEAKGGLLAFIDDDEVADPYWLSALRQAVPNHAAAFGPVTPVYPATAPRAGGVKSASLACSSFFWSRPRKTKTDEHFWRGRSEWMREAAPHRAEPVMQQGVLKAGYAGNCLLDLRHPALDGLQFDEALGRTGGEDTAFFYEGFRRGAQYVMVDGAQINEPVAEGRLSLRWLLRRRFDAGLRLHQLGLLKARTAPLKVVYCLCSALLRLTSPAKRNSALLRCSLHLGTIGSALGGRSSRPYGGEG